MTHPVQRRVTLKRSGLRRFAVLLLVLLLAEQGSPWLLGSGRLRRYVTAKLQATFGRPVEAGGFEIALFAPPRLEARYVTVGEDPRFGHEHLLRAERLSAGLRWRSLLRGRIEFDTLAFTRPSLNLVRNAAGEWNLAGWLPAPAEGAPAPAPGLLYRIEVDGGRINFKQGPEKHPFALVEVAGTVEQEAPGRWRVDLESQLMRSTVTVQEAGTIRVRGRIGGTPARLRPADLRLGWEDASLADVLRLVRGHDFGVRGRVSLDLTAKIDDAPPSSSPTVARPWLCAGVARLRGVHRWDLPPRPGDPALNLIFEAAWFPGESRVELARGVIEAPRSHLRLSGSVAWGSRGVADPKRQAPWLRVTSSGVALSDVFAWYRAFRPGVSDGVSLEGNAGLDIHLGGWAPRMEHGVVAAEGLQLRSPELPAPLAASRVVLRSERDALVLAPVTLGFGVSAPPSPAASAGRAGGTEPAVESEGIRVEGKAWPRRNRLELSVAGRLARAQDLLAAAAALGRPLFPEWSLEGEAGLNLLARGTLQPLVVRPAGFVELRRVSLRSNLLNVPLRLANARLQMGADRRELKIVVAQAFGASWAGSVWTRDAGPWEFSLSTPRLHLGEVERGLNPWRRASLLERLPFRDSDAPAAEPGILRTRVRGKINAAELLLPPLVFRRVAGQLALDGRSLRFDGRAQDFYGGGLRASVRAEIAAPPAYAVQSALDDVQLAALAETAAAWKGRVAGQASGTLTLRARGSTREELRGSLEGQGAFDLRRVALRAVDLREALRSGAARPGVGDFDSGSARLGLREGKLQVDLLELRDRLGGIRFRGEVVPPDRFELRAWTMPPRTGRAEGEPPPSASLTGDGGILLSGTLRSPVVQKPPAKPPR